MQIFHLKPLDSSEPMNYNKHIKFRTDELRKEDTMATNNEWRASVVIPKEIEERIIELRKTDRFARCSISEIMRILIKKGLDECASPALEVTPGDIFAADNPA